jgi:DNA-binding NarL/FixJ family response regulator
MRVFANGALVASEYHSSCGVPDGGSNMTRILIADDHDVVRAGVRHFLECHTEWSVVAEAADGKQAIDKCISTAPDVAILDYGLPLINGLEATRQIRLHAPNVEVLILTMHDNNNVLREMLRAGARGYLLKADAGEHLIAAIESLAARKPYFTAHALEMLLDGFRNAGPQNDEPLTSRERVVVQMVAEGHSNKNIARILEINPRTVETHRASILRKLNFTSTAALVRHAIRNKVIEA